MDAVTGVATNPITVAMMTVAAVVSAIKGHKWRVDKRKDECQRLFRISLNKPLTAEQIATIEEVIKSRYEDYADVCGIVADLRRNNRYQESGMLSNEMEWAAIRLSSAFDKARWVAEHYAADPPTVLRRLGYVAHRQLCNAAN